MRFILTLADECPNYGIVAKTSTIHIDDERARPFNPMGTILAFASAFDHLKQLNAHETFSAQSLKHSR
jgi:hypothetical protein